MLLTVKFEGWPWKIRESMLKDLSKNRILSWGWKWLYGVYSWGLMKSLILGSKCLFCYSTMMCWCLESAETPGEPTFSSLHPNVYGHKINMDATWEAYTDECAWREGELSSSESGGGSDEEEEAIDIKKASNSAGQQTRKAMPKKGPPTSWAVLHFVTLTNNQHRAPILLPIPPAGGKDVLSGMKKVMRALVTQCYSEWSSSAMW